MQIQNKIPIKFKRLHPNSVVPMYAKPGDAGMDLTATSKTYDEHGNVVYGTGLAMELPEGYVCLLFPRSSNSKKDLILSNSVGILDSGYRGEVFLKFKPSAVYGNNQHGLPIVNIVPVVEEYKVGDRIGQMLILPYPTIESVEVDELSESERGTGGFGSTGN